jgi:ankyrin repeat protein
MKQSTTSDRLEPLNLTPVFTGEQRLQAQELLSSMLTKKNFAGVTELIKKDPTLTLETIPVTTKRFESIYQLDFPFACIDHGYVDGVVFAIQHGYPINKILPTGETLLSHAVTHYSSQRHVQWNEQKRDPLDGSVIRLLLSMGADPNIPRPDNSMNRSNFAWFMLSNHSESLAPDLTTANAFLDAGADVRYSNKFLCPLSIAVVASGWYDSSTCSPLIEFMTRCVKAGAEIDSLSGGFSSTPLQRATGRENINAILALVRLGAKPEVRGKSLIEHLESCPPSVRKHIPDIQNAIIEGTIANQIALMERTISASLAANPPPETIKGNTSIEPRTSRRRMGGI